MKKKHLLRSILAIALCILMIGTVIAVGYTIYENVQGKKVVIDKDNNLPVVKPSNGSVSAPVTTENGLTVSDVTLKTNNDGVLAVIPQGTKLNDGVKEVTLTVKEIKDSQANIKLEDNEEKVSYDIHIEGVANDNTAPIKVYVKEMLPSGLNMGNYSLYHVENGTTTAMTAVNGDAAHNSFEYDAATGNVTLYLASFSEVALVADTTKAWEGNFDYSWYTNAVALAESKTVTEYTIANADQLAAFGAIVGGMNGQTKDSFAGKTVKLIADINLGDKNNANESLIFHPIGYYYTDDKNADGTTGDYYSTVYSFGGTFDGNGNTISNFYQNTWEIKGDYDGNYYKDAMGLFGYVVNGTVKNLTVDNFSSDGEFTPTGVIAAYASGDSKFENIAITNCNPRVYNTGNGGIIGVAGDTKDSGNSDKTITLKNITVDQTNKISALWGSYDVACGGLAGMFRGYSNLHMKNCHVAAEIDVNNDVCGNYQYYWYRYSGMFIGSVRRNTTDGNYTVAYTDNITADGCTYTLGTWNEYWYCELVANTIASYTHDHQFSRLTKINNISDIQDKNGNWNVAGNFVIPSADNTSAECYHIFKDSEGKLYQHLHDVADESNPNIYESFDLNGDGKLNDLKEDRVCYFMPFNQLLNGDGYGVKAHYTFENLSENKNGVVESEAKFEATGNIITYRPGQTILLGDLVNSIVDDTKLSKISIFVAVSPKTENDTAEATYTLDLSNWKNSTIVFSENCRGSVKIVITDYFYCTPTVIYLDQAQVEKFSANTVDTQDAYSQITLGDLFGIVDGATIGNVSATVTDPNGNATTIDSAANDWASKTIDLTKNDTWTVTIKDDDILCKESSVTFTVNKVDKFTKKFDKDFLYRVGNNANSPVTVGTIFEEIKTAVDLSSVKVTITNVAGNASGTFTSNDTWSNGEIQFSGTGVVKVTISADGANDVSINLEVIDATNLKDANGTTTGGDFVLLCDVNTSTYVNYWNCTLYGNGFTYSLKGAPTAYNSKQGKGIIIAKNAVLDNLVIVGDVYNAYGAYTNQDFYNTAIDVTGDTTIQNCYISGCAAPLRARNNVTIINSTLYGGAVGNLIIDAGTVTLEDVTTANYDDGRTVVGMGIVIHSDATESAKLVLKGKLTQYNFINESKVPSDSYASNLHNAMFNDSCSQYHFGTSPNRYVNTGIISLTDKFNASNITDNANTGYVGKSVTVGGVNGYVYTQPQTNGSVNNNYLYDHDHHVATTQGAVSPSYSFDHTKNQHNKVEGSNLSCTFDNGVVNISFDEGETFEWATSILTVTKNGKPLDYYVTMNGETYTGKITFSKTGEYTVTYTYTDTDNYYLDANGNIATYEKKYTKEVRISALAVEPEAKNAEFTFGSSNTASTTITIGDNTYVMPNVSGTSSSFGSTTVGGKTIYYPIVEIIMSDGKTSHSSGWYAYFPVLKNAVTITDKDTIYSGSTTTMPSNLNVLGTPAELFKYQSSSSANSSPEVKNNILVYSSAEISADRNDYNTVIEYYYKDSKGDTFHYYIGYHAPKQTYSGCITADTLVTMADGTQKYAEDLVVGDMVLVFNHVSGQLESMPIIFNNHNDNEAGDYDVLHLQFSDNSELKIVSSHGLFDTTLMQYVYIDYDNYQDFIGHEFYSIDGTRVTLTNAYIANEYTKIFCPVSYFHMNIFANGLLTTPNIPGDITGLVNYFEYDEDLKYNEEAMQRDIELYGLYTYEDFSEYISEAAYNSSPSVYLKVAVGKGLITFEEILAVIEYLLSGSLID